MSASHDCHVSATKQICHCPCGYCDVAIKFMMKIIMFVMFIFVIENGFGLGFGGLGTFYDDFKIS